MDVLNKPARVDRDTYTDRYEDDRVRKDLAYTGNTDSFFATIEYTDARMIAIKASKVAHAKEACVMTRPSGGSNFNGKIVNISNPSQHDNTEEITIQIEVIP